VKRLSLNESGLTLVELGVALTVTAFLVTIIVSFSVAKLRQGSLQTEQNVLLSNAETGLNVVANDVRLATRADANNRWQDQNAPSAPTNLLSWTSSSSTLVLATAAQDAHHNILFDDAHDYITTKNNIIYYVKNRSLYKRILAAPVANNAALTTCPTGSASASCPADKRILDNVSSFTVQYYDGSNTQVTPTNARSIQLSVQLAIAKYGENKTVNYTTRMVFRNG